MDHHQSLEDTTLSYFLGAQQPLFIPPKHEFRDHHLGDLHFAFCLHSPSNTRPLLCRTRVHGTLTQIIHAHTSTGQAGEEVIISSGTALLQSRRMWVTATSAGPSMSGQQLPM